MSTFSETQMLKFRTEKLLENTFKLLKTVAFAENFLLVVVSSLYDNYLKKPVILARVLSVFDIPSNHTNFTYHLNLKNRERRGGNIFKNSTPNF